MSSNRSGIVGLITGAVLKLAEFGEPHGLPNLFIVQDIQRVMADANTILMIADTSGLAKRIHTLINIFLQYRVEGVSSSRSEFRHYLSFSIYVEADQKLRLKRGLERDGEEMLPLWQQWMAEKDEYALRDQPQEYVDVVISGNTEDMLRIRFSF
jgi:hypothetical protein